MDTCRTKITDQQNKKEKGYSKVNKFGTVD